MGGLCSSGEEDIVMRDSERTSYLDSMPVATEKEVSRALDKKIFQERKERKEVVKLLLLGTGGSGKSTLFKQMVALYGSGFNDKERLLYAPIIHSNVVVSMQALIAAAPLHGGMVACEEEKKIVQRAKDSVFDTSLAEVLRTLWQDPGIQCAYQNSSRFQLMDSAKYFLDQVEVLASPSYIPSMQDVLRSRVQTRGIAEQAFDIEGYEWRMFDMGGQRSERKKWIHCFENVTAVIFVGTLSEYDLLLEEDSTQNRMVETLKLFEEICNSHYFRDSSMVLFLNKRDLFAEKILHVPLQVCPAFANTQIPQTYEAGCKAIERAFLAKRQDPDKLVYVHVTCATDSDNISTVFHAVRDTVIRIALRRAGVLG